MPAQREFWRNNFDKLSVAAKKFPTDGVKVAEVVAAHVVMEHPKLSKLSAVQQNKLIQHLVSARILMMEAISRHIEEWKKAPDDEPAFLRRVNLPELALGLIVHNEKQDEILRKAQASENHYELSGYFHAALSELIKKLQEK